jgi:transcriptional regulator with XRE-family HTH domain
MYFQERSPPSVEFRAARAPEVEGFPQVPNPVDVHVGWRLKLRRTLLGMSQEKLGEMLGLTFQQIQKYERGVNRIGASRLYQIAQILDVPVSFFFDDMPTGAVAGYGPGLREESVGFEYESAEEPPLERRETLELVRAYHRITNPTVRKRLFELTKALGAHYTAATDVASLTEADESA